MLSILLIPAPVATSRQWGGEYAATNSMPKKAEPKQKPLGKICVCGMRIINQAGHVCPVKRGYVQVEMPTLSQLGEGVHGQGL